MAWNTRDWDHTVAAWYNEVVYFVFGQGTNDKDQAVGHYTQVKHALIKFIGEKGYGVRSRG